MNAQACLAAYRESYATTSTRFDVPLGNNSAFYRCTGMSSNSANEWNLLKEQFDAMVRNDCARQDNLEDVLDHQVRRRFGILIARATGHESDYGARRHRKPLR